VAVLHRRRGAATVLLRAVDARGTRPTGRITCPCSRRSTGSPATTWTRRSTRAVSRSRCETPPPSASRANLTPKDE
jgi:hypothetical protein